MFEQAKLAQGTSAFGRGTAQPAAGVGFGAKPQRPLRRRGVKGQSPGKILHFKGYLDDFL